MGRLHQGDDPGGGWLPYPNQNGDRSMSNQEQLRTKVMNHNQVLALRGLPLPAMTLKSLKAAGIYCQPSVSIEHQHQDVQGIASLPPPEARLRKYAESRLRSRIRASLLSEPAFLE